MFCMLPSILPYSESHDQASSTGHHLKSKIGFVLSALLCLFPMSALVGLKVP